MSDVAPYAIGKLGETVRLRIVTMRAEALAQRGENEVCCLLNFLPPADVPYMILLDGSDVVPVPASLDDLKNAKWQEAKAYREMRAEGGCDTPKGRVDTDADSQRKIVGAVTAANLLKAVGQPFSVNWTMHDNSVVAHDADEISLMGIIVMQHIAACQSAGDAIRSAIISATSGEEVAAINITANYPD